MPELAFHPLSPAYADEIRALLIQTQTTHQARLPHIFVDGGAQQQKLLDLILSGDLPDQVQGVMALQGDALAGYVLLILEGAENEGAPINTLIADICVSPDFRRQGVAQALLDHCANLKTQRGWESLRAQVWLGNAASHALFQSAGYAAERTEYRLGQPSVPVFEPMRPHWKNWAALLGFIALILMIACIAT